MALVHHRASRHSSRSKLAHSPSIAPKPQQSDQQAGISYHVLGGKTFTFGPQLDVVFCACSATDTNVSHAQSHLTAVQNKALLDFSQTGPVTFLLHELLMLCTLDAFCPYRHRSK